jgi:Transposase zinc-ribbon domain
MKPVNDLPQTLLEAISNPDVCTDFMASLRWPDGIARSPRCESTESYYLATRRVWKRKGCKKQFSIKVGTIMEHSPITLDKWLAAIWLIANAKNGISSYEIHRGTHVSIEPFHLFRYLDREAFRFNKRKSTDAERFVDVLRLTSGRRIGYKQLTGSYSY